MPVIEWGSCANCGRSCAGPHGSFCSDVCESVYTAKKATGKKPKPATPTDQPTHQVPKKVPKTSSGCRKKFALLAGTTGAVAAGAVFALVKAAKALR